MRWLRLFFDPRGRLNRAKFWSFVGLFYGLGLIFSAAGAALTGVTLSRAETVTFTIVSCAVSLPVLVGMLIVPAKRLHDRGRSGWWWVAYLLAPAGMLAALNWLPLDSTSQTTMMMVLIGIGFLSGVWLVFEFSAPGTAGPNRYGPDPLARD